MTCKDCIHYNSINATEGRCDKMTYLGIVDVVNAEYKSCKEYEDKDGLYSDGTWHCPRCGKAVSEWGLCDECDSWESVSK
jgi:ubiquitin C-terminal hydrolase